MMCSRKKGEKMIVKMIALGMYQTNAYLAYDEKSKKGFLVDPGTYSETLMDIIESEKIDIEYIVLTHGHLDHIGGVEKFTEKLGNPKLVAGKKEAEMLKDPRLNMTNDISLEADIWVKEGDTLQCGNMTFEFYETPGHTKGGIIFLIDDVLFAGDTIFCESIGRTDLEGGSFEEIAESIKTKIYTLPDETQILPGHMGTTTVGHEKKHNPFVRP